MSVPGVERVPVPAISAATGVRPDEDWETGYLRDTLADLPLVYTTLKLEPRDPVEPFARLSEDDKTQLARHTTGFLVAAGRRPGSPLEHMTTLGTQGDARERALNEHGVRTFVGSAISSLAAISRARSRQHFWETGDANAIPELLKLPDESQRRLAGMAGSMALQFLHVAIKNQPDFLPMNRLTMPYPSLSIFQGPIGGLVRALELRPTDLGADLVIKAFAGNGAVFRNPHEVIRSLTESNGIKKRHYSAEAKAAAKRRRKHAAFNEALDELRNDPDIAVPQALELRPGQSMILHEGSLGPDRLARLIAKYTLIVGNNLYVQQPDKEEGRPPIAMESFEDAGHRLFRQGLTGTASALTLSMLGADAPPPHLAWDPERIPLRDMRRLIFSFNRTLPGGTRLLDARQLHVFLDHRDFGNTPYTHVRRTTPPHVTEREHEELLNTVKPLRDDIIIP